MQDHQLQGIMKLAKHAAEGKHITDVDTHIRSAEQKAQMKAEISLIYRLRTSFLLLLPFYLDSYSYVQPVITKHLTRRHIIISVGELFNI